MTLDPFALTPTSSQVTCIMSFTAWDPKLLSAKVFVVIWNIPAQHSKEFHTIAKSWWLHVQEPPDYHVFRFHYKSTSVNQ